jgi:hypothetical protein
MAALAERRQAKAKSAPEGESLVDYYFQKGLHIDQGENGPVDSGFYLMIHLIKMGHPFGQDRLDAFERGYAIKLKGEGKSEEEVKTKIADFEVAAWRREERESLAELERAKAAKLLIKDK